MRTPIFCPQYSYVGRQAVSQTVANQIHTKRVENLTGAFNLCDPVNITKIQPVKLKCPFVL